MKKTSLTLILLLVFAFLTRVPYLINQSVAFDFDHGRDLLAGLHIVKTGSLRFVGPWTSIPGLFFGPGWYYFLALISFISSHPAAPVWGMLGLGLLQIILVFRFFGFWEAIIVATAPTWVTLSTGASNAFPMTLITWLGLILLKPVIDKKRVSIKQIIGLGIVMAMGFHFSSALAIFYLLIVPLILIINKVRFNWKKVLAGLGGFLMPFIPQILFEVKNKFIQTKAVISYFSEDNVRSFKLSTIEYYAKAVMHEMQLGAIPETMGENWPGLTLLGLGLVMIIIKRKRIKYFKEIIVFMVVPMIGFSFLHFNVWYAYGLLPITVLLTAQIIKKSPRIIQGLYLILLILTPLFGLRQYYVQAKPMIDNGKAFLPVKIRALDYVYQQANNQPFSSYQYVAEIYDYGYQYLYFWSGFKGRDLPVEFSYKPGEISYAIEKPELLKLFPKRESKSEKTFLILNLPENKHHYPLKAWMDQFKVKEVISKKQISEEVWVWEVILN